MAGINTVKRKVATNSIIADIQNMLISTSSFNEGDFLMVDTTNHVIKKLVGETDGVTFAGVALVTIVNGVFPSGYVTSTDASLKTPSVPGPNFGDEYGCLLKSGDTLSAGDAVYADPASATRGVQAAGTKIIGIYTGAEGASVTGVTGGLEITCKIGSRYPGDTLKF